ncbi:MAG: alpha/beta fold hydrolase [Planctomycetota bacterium]
MANFEELTIPLPDGYESYARFWRADRALGAVLYHHGIQSHCGWYENSATKLCEAGFHVLQFDRRGCGRNPKDRGHADSADQLIQDAIATGDELKQLSGFADYQVVGVSWGGKLAVAAHVSRPNDVRSLSLVTPGLFPLTGVSNVEKARIGFAMLYEPRRAFDIPLNDSDLFTTNSQWKAFIEGDPLTLRQCTAGFYLASRRMDKITAKLGTVRPVPIHTLLADDEHIIDNDATAEFIRHLTWPARRVTWYDNARHSLEFENDPSRYCDDLVSFIREQA